jgi:DNA-binding transcriptional ArsR family regulator
VVSAARSAATTASEIFKAIGDPIRWSILQQIAEVDELPASRLEETLPVSKPTISYHMKILSQAGLVSIRKGGRNYFYTLRRDVLHEAMDAVWAMAPLPKTARPNPALPPPRDGVPETGTEQDREAIILTW